MLPPKRCRGLTGARWRVVFGDAPAVGRVIVWLTEMAGLAALLALFRRVRDTGLALGFLLAFAVSPLALVELRQVQPDGPTGMFAAIAAFFRRRSTAIIYVALDHVQEGRAPP